MPERPVALETGATLVDETGTPLVYEYVVPVAPAPTPYTSADYAAELLAHMPDGPIWPRDEDAGLARVMRSLAPSIQRVDARGLVLLQETPAGTLVEMLPEWEATLGLPDPCAGAQPTLALRQRIVRARLAAQGGQSVPYYAGVAAALGFAIGITEYAPSRYDRRGYGLPRYGPDWTHAWLVTTTATVIEAAQYGSHRFGEPYRTWGSRVLECTLNGIKPAHTTLIFGYLGASTAALWDAGAWDRDAWAA